MLDLHLTSSVVSIGNFDGVHVGHQAILSSLIAAGKSQSAATVAITFDPHPSQVLGYPTPKLLMPPKDRASEILRFGVDHCVIEKFTKAFSKQSPRIFIDELLIKHLGMKVLVIGPTTHIGQKREGTPDQLKALSTEMGFKLQIVSPKEFEGGVVSSSRIRQEIEMGNVELASKLLGHTHWNRGEVVKGEGRGKTIGFPTANLAISTTLQIPGNGVYATWLEWKGNQYLSVTNVGVRPTFKTDGARCVETHIIDVHEELAGCEVTLQWVSRLRDEIQFPSAKALVEQIKNDISQARQCLGNLKSI